MAGSIKVAGHIIAEHNIASDTVSIKNATLDSSIRFPNDTISDASLDLNGKDLVIDADGDTKISATTDDKLNFHIGNKLRRTEGYHFNQIFFGQDSTNSRTQTKGCLEIDGYVHTADNVAQDFVLFHFSSSSDLHAFYSIESSLDDFGNNHFGRFTYGRIFSNDALQQVSVSGNSDSLGTLSISKDSDGLTHRFRMQYNSANAGGPFMAFRMRIVFSDVVSSFSHAEVV